MNARVLIIVGGFVFVGLGAAVAQKARHRSDTGAITVPGINGDVAAETGAGLAINAASNGAALDAYLNDRAGTTGSTQTR